MSGNYDDDDDWHPPTDDDWHPPTEAEMKVLQAKRERSDKISKLMGDYLLKGYKMLATVCGVCSTILLQDRQSQIYCVACMEVDCHENSKDNPALSTQAADQAIAESAYVTICDNTSPTHDNSVHAARSSHGNISPTPRLSREPPDVVLLSSPPSNLPQREQIRTPEEPPLLLMPRSAAPGPSNSRPRDKNLCESLESSLSAVVEKLCWSSRQLGETENIEQSIKIVTLVKQCADTVVSLRTAMQS